MNEAAPRFTKPAALNAAHELANFDSGEPTLDEWLRRRALTNAAAQASRTYVVCRADSMQVVGYYALSMGQVMAHEVTGAMRRNMPNYIPAVVLGRLAVDRSLQRQGVGQAMLNDVVRRALFASETVAARLVIVQAISTAAEEFYGSYGFVKLPLEGTPLALDLVKYRRYQERDI